MWRYSGSGDPGPTAAVGNAEGLVAGFEVVSHRREPTRLGEPSTWALRLAPSR